MIALMYGGVSVPVGACGRDSFVTTENGGLKSSAS